MPGRTLPEAAVKRHTPTDHGWPDVYQIRSEVGRLRSVIIGGERENVRMVVPRTPLILVALVLAGCSVGQPGGGSTPSPNPAGVAVTGTVTAAPGCPGPQRADTSCPPKPVAGARVEIEAGGVLVASTTADASGRFRLVVAPGTYQITAHNVGFASETSQDITVTGPVDLALQVDSGLR
jgi:hypothetical protein